MRHLALEGTEVHRAHALARSSLSLSCAQAKAPWLPLYGSNASGPSYRLGFLEIVKPREGTES
jgi:hypothetical protein